MFILFVCFWHNSPPPGGQGLLIHEVSISRTTTHHSWWDSSGRVISSSQRSLPDNTQHPQQTNIHAPAGFEPAIPASERPQTYALDRATTGTGNMFILLQLYNIYMVVMDSFYFLIVFSAKADNVRVKHNV